MFVNHHIKYKEIHGVDEIIKMDKGEHKKLHERLRKEGKCKIPSKELAKISSVAYSRTEHGKKARAEYHKNKLGKILFTETFGARIRLCEEIIYILNTCNVCITSYFRGDSIKLPVIKEVIRGE